MTKPLLVGNNKTNNNRSNCSREFHSLAQVCGNFKVYTDISFG